MFSGGDTTSKTGSLAERGGFVLGGADFGTQRPAGVAPIAAGAVGGQNQTVTQNAKVEVDFKNMPRGTSVKPAENNSAPIDLSMGYAMTAFP